MELEMDRLERLHMGAPENDSAAKLTYSLLKSGKPLYKLTGKRVVAKGVGDPTKVDCSSSVDVDQYWTEWVLWTEFRVDIYKDSVSSDPPVPDRSMQISSTVLIHDVIDVKDIDA